METEHCRICFSSRGDLSEICDEIRQIFHSLTSIHLINSEIYSSFICQECKGKLQSTRNYINLLAANEARLAADNSLANKDHKIFSYSSEIKIENEEMEVEGDRKELDGLVKELKRKSDRGKKRNTTEITEESSLTHKVENLKVEEETIQKLSKKSSKVHRETSNKRSSKVKDLELGSTKSGPQHNAPRRFKENDQSAPQSGGSFHHPTTKSGKIICHDCNRPILESNYNDHISQRHVKDITFMCDSCHKKFHQKASLECHMHIHLKIKPYTCPKNCGKSFYSKHGLYFHYKMHHQPINEFICEICGKSFKQSHLLQEHIDAKHDGVRYKCTYEGCGNQYNTKSGLKKHIISIHKCKIVPCEFCGELFRTGFSLYQHVRINHKERKFVCEYDGCDKKFVIKTHYRDHLKMHTGKKDFICNHCDASYHKKRNLMRHIEVVHQKSRFFCQIDGCNAALCNKDNYRAHLRKVHASHPDIKELLTRVANMKPVYLRHVADAHEEVEEFKI